MPSHCLKQLKDCPLITATPVSVDTSYSLPASDILILHIFSRLWKCVGKYRVERESSLHFQFHSRATVFVKRIYKRFNVRWDYKNHYLVTFSSIWHLCFIISVILNYLVRPYLAYPLYTNIIQHLHWKLLQGTSSMPRTWPETHMLFYFLPTTSWDRFAME